MLRKAVIPAAGLGTRMLPMTLVLPKELFPLGDKPVIQHVVEEAVAAGLTEICIVIRRGKELIRDYFTGSPSAGANCARVAALRDLVGRCRLTFAEQNEPAGLGDAILAAREFVGDERFVMLVPDQILPHATEQLVAADDGRSIVSSIVRIERADIQFFSGARGFALRPISSGRYAVERVLEDEETTEVYGSADYELRGFGRTIYSPAFFDYLGREFMNPITGEVDLLKSFDAAAPLLGHLAVSLQGRPADVGTLAGYYRFLGGFAEVAA